MKQSSVDWLIDTMRRSAGLDQNQIDDIFEEAKAMHQKEIEYANYIGQSLHAKYTTDLMMRENAEYYYIEEFKTKNNE